jgi:tRNA(Ile)-lysidine synthase
MKNLIKKVQNTASLNNLWKRNSKIMVGVSGGPDSACLLDIMAKIRDKSEIELHIAHIDYGLRGKDSDKDEKLVQELAEKYQLGLSVLKPEKLKGFQANEENLRNIRYDFFEKVRQELEFDLIAVAHNQDDQVETFFLHLLRGAGLQGLSGMKYKNEKVIRPLLGILREEILEYLKKEKLKYRTDKTNKTNKFFRNKIRNKLIPYLEKNFNPNIKKTMADATLNIAEDFSLILELSKKYFENSKEIRISQILKLHPALQRRMIIEMIKNKKGNLKDIMAAHIEEIMKIVKRVKSKRQTFSFQGLKITRRGDRLNLTNLNK